MRRGNASLVVLFLTAASILSVAQAPSLTAQTPLIGNTGSAFFVLLPVANLGNARADNITVTSVALTLLGSSVATVLVPATLPEVVGYAEPTGVQWLDLEFDNSHLVTGTRYLVKVSGTYDAGGTTSGFSLTRYVVDTAGPTSHAALMDIIAKKFQALPGVDAAADNQGLVTFIQGLPQISGAELNAGHSTIWAQFADNGEAFLVFNNLTPPSTPITSSPRLPKMQRNPNRVPISEDFGSVVGSPATASFPNPTELPANANVRLLNGLGSGFEQELPDLNDYLFSEGYVNSAVGVGYGPASVANLRKVSGDAVLYISSHGGADDKHNFPFNIYTTTVYQDADKIKDITLKNDLLTGRLVGGVANDHWDSTNGKWIPETHFGITATFVDKYWGNFGRNSLFYFSGCEGDLNAVSAQQFKAEIFKKQASVYVGWSDMVYDDQRAGSARLVFDRLLGVDQYCPEDGTACHPGPATPPTFAQRAFDWTQVLQDLPKHNLGLDPKSGAKLNFTANPGYPKVFGLLAPSVGQMIPEEGTHQLFLSGSFGSNPGPNGIVTLDGLALAIEKWTPELITADLPQTGEAGDVIVTVRGHKSNTATLTKWKGGFTAKVTGPGSAKQTVVFQPSFRADLRKVRYVIHEPPIEPTSSGIELITSESSAPYSCGGTYTVTSPGRTDTYTWKGAGTLTPWDKTSLSQTNPPPTSPYFSIVGALVMSHTQMSFQLTALSGSGNPPQTPCKWDDHWVEDGPPQTQGNINNQPLDIAFSNLNFNLQLGDTDSTIKSGSAKFSVSCGNTNCPVKVTWTSIAPVDGTAPDPSSPR